MNNFIKIFLLGSSLFFGGCFEVDTPDKIVAVGGHIVVDLDAATVKKSLLDDNVPGVSKETTVYGYKAYKIPYLTTDEEGVQVSASGLMVVPTGMPSLVYQIGLSLVSDSHATILADDAAPTVLAQKGADPRSSALIFSSIAGFVTLQADYIGFGDSRAHYHPFILKKSSVNATIDFIAAAQNFAKENNIKLNGQLFLTGYSEGGYTALATLQAIEQAKKISVTMTAPMAGPYELYPLAKDILSKPELSAPSFITNLAYSYAIAHNQPLSSVIQEPYTSQLPDLLGGEYDLLEVNAELTSTTTGENGLFQPLFVSNLLNSSNSWFSKALVDNSVDDWSPKTPVRLLHCQGDTFIPYQISVDTLNKMNQNGANDVEIMPVEPLLDLTQKIGHSACGLLAYRLTAQMFATIRKNTMKY